MEKLLEQYFGCKVELKERTEPMHLPIFMTMRQIKQLRINAVNFAVVDISKETELTIAAMKKQKKKYEEALQCPVAYMVRIDSISMRNAMVKNGIYFVDLPGNIYLPFLGIALLDVFKKQIVRADKMMPATQLVFLELYYMEEGQSFTKSEIAKRLNLTRTSVTRATVQLEQMGLIKQSKRGTEIHIMRNHPRREYYEKAKEYLINPVQKIIAVSAEDIGMFGFKAGETALSMQTELNPPRIEEFAVYKGAEIVEQLEIVDIRCEEQSKCAKMQLWKYDPFYFAKNGSVDVVSLACTFKDMEDERIEMCIEELLEEK